MMHRTPVLLAGLALAASCGAFAQQPTAPKPQVVVAEGEFFKPQGANGWRVTHMEDSYASHNYGGMWMSQGGCLGAPADSDGAVATQTVQIPADGDYRVWSKYQSPAYYNYLHKIEVLQGGKAVFSQVYGKAGTPRLWSFGAKSNELWWFWGLDHDAAEAPAAAAALRAGPAEIRLSTVPALAPAGDRMIDFVLLTTRKEDAYEGTVGTPFANEALGVTRLFMRFKNTSAAPAKLAVSRAGHFQPNYGGANAQLPDAPVPAGDWSPWFNIGPFCRLVHDEGVWMTVKDAASIPLEFARQPDGSDKAGTLTVANGDPVVVPVDITWNREHTVMASREHARTIADLARKRWRTANAGRKPEYLLYYGAFNPKADWVMDLKDALGYNTLLPDKYAHVACDGYHQHCHNEKELEAYVKNIPDKSKFRIMSFGDEIHLGTINWNDPAMQTAFVAWLQAKKLTKADLGVDPEQAKLADRGANRRIGWYAQTFNEEQRFASFRDLTALAKKLIGPQVETGANYSPHCMPMYYGPIYQWVDIFKHNGMTMFWGEDYIFSVPHFPQMISWMMATMRCATKYNNQLIHIYVMPHAPGQRADYLRRNMMYAVGGGARSIDSFWVAAPESFTENFIAWDYKDHYRAVHESIYDAAAAEGLLKDGKVRSGRVAVVLSKATDHNERNLKVAKAQDPFAARCENAPATVEQIIDRVEAQLLYLGLKQAGHMVDLITEDDIVDGALKGYDAVYVAGEWIDHRVPPVLGAWVEAGGVLYADAGCGYLNEFGEPEPGLAKVLGLKNVAAPTKNLVCVRPLMELPLAEPIDTLTVNGQAIKAVGLRQVLEPAGAKVLATWADGKPAATVHELGKGKAFAVGTLAGSAYYKTGVKAQPWARGGKRAAIVPEGFQAAAADLVLLGVTAKPVTKAVTCSNPYVEAMLIDSPQGTLLTLVNWSANPIKDLTVSVRLPAAPREVRTVQGNQACKATYADGAATFTTDLEWGEFVLLPK